VKRIWDSLDPHLQTTTFLPVRDLFEELSTSCTIKNQLKQTKRTRVPLLKAETQSGEHPIHSLHNSNNQQNNNNNNNHNSNYNNNTINRSFNNNDNKDEYECIHKHKYESMACLKLIVNFTTEIQTIRTSTVEEEGLQ
jgi:hypothetical protein